jgi:hypothetical protein
MEGCCSYGAHFSDAKDAARVRKAAKALTKAQWQFRSTGRRKPGVIEKDAEGSLSTRLVADACIFLNRPGHPGGPGCALHRAAIEQGIAPLALKPDVCWQLPLRREDTVGPNGHVTSTLGEWDRQHWGEGGAQFHWWCTEASEAFSGNDPVYKSLSDEIVAMTGQGVYDKFVAYLTSRAASGNRLLAHPSVRAAAQHSGTAPSETAQPG